MKKQTIFLPVNSSAVRMRAKRLWPPTK